jgi:hypothetical protein
MEMQIINDAYNYIDNKYWVEMETQARWIFHQPANHVKGTYRREPNIDGKFELKFSDSKLTIHTKNDYELVLFPDSNSMQWFNSIKKRRRIFTIENS